MTILNSAITNPGKSNGWLYTAELANQLGKSPRQTLATLKALETRGLIETKHSTYGKCARALLPDGTPATTPTEHRIAQAQDADYQLRRAYFDAMNEVTARGLTFTAQDVRELAARNLGQEYAPSPCTLSGVFAHYIRHGRIERAGTCKDNMYRTVPIYVPISRMPLYPRGA